MHKSLNTLGLASAAFALAMTPALASAQDQTQEQVMPESMPQDAAPTGTPPVETPPEAAMPAPAPAAEPTLSAAEIDAKVQALPAEQQTALKAWAPEVQSYYWTLSEDRQELFWKIADGDKATLATMAEPQREATWVELETRVKAMQG